MTFYSELCVFRQFFDSFKDISEVYYAHPPEPQPKIEKERFRTLDLWNFSHHFFVWFFFRAFGLCDLKCEKCGLHNFFFSTGEKRHFLGTSQVINGLISWHSKKINTQQLFCLWAHRLEWGTAWNLAFNFLSLFSPQLEFEVLFYLATRNIQKHFSDIFQQHKKVKINYLVIFHVDRFINWTLETE